MSDRTMEEYLSNTKMIGELPNAWISPNGRFVWVYYMHHVDFAGAYSYSNEHKEKFTVFIGEHCGRTTVDFLHSEGWVRLLTWSNGKTIICGNCESDVFRLQTRDPAMNMKQKKILKDWCLENNITYESLF